MFIIVGVDDVHPKKFWGLLDDPQIAYFKQVNQKYGVKFTLFIPSNYHGQYPLSQHKDWLDALEDLGFIEFGAHGHFHDTQHKRDQAEFFELNTELSAEHRVNRILEEWDAAGYRPNVWKSPGWLTSQESANVLSKHFKYVHGHPEHSRRVNWGTSALFGHIGIDQQEIRIDGEVAIFQSHINGERNTNNWNEPNSRNFSAILNQLSQHNPKYVGFEELIELKRAEPVVCSS